jgi:hypothetical protein
MKTATKQRMYRLRYWNKANQYTIETRTFSSHDEATKHLQDKEAKILDITYLATSK